MSIFIGLTDSATGKLVMLNTSMIVAAEYMGPRLTKIYMSADRLRVNVEATVEEVWQQVQLEQNPPGQ